MKEKLVIKLDVCRDRECEYNEDCFHITRSELYSILDEYADWKIKECLPDKLPNDVDNYKHTRDFTGYYDKGFNACIDQMLINADIKCKGCGQERCRCGETYNEPYSGFDAIA